MAWQGNYAPNSHKGPSEICPRCGLSHRFLLFLSPCQHSFELLFRSHPGSLILFSLFLFFSISRYSFSTTLAVTSLTRSSVSSLPMRPHSFPMTNEEIFLSLISAQLWEFCPYKGISHFVVLTCCLSTPSPLPQKKRLLGQIIALVGGPVCKMGIVDSVNWNPGYCHQLAIKGWLVNPYLEKGGSSLYQPCQGGLGSQTYPSIRPNHKQTALTKVWATWKYLNWFSQPYWK